MITTSPKPWVIIPDGTGAIIRDAIGNEVARFKDWRDAELAVRHQQPYSQQAPLTQFARD